MVCVVSSVHRWKCRNGEWEVRDMILGAHSADYNGYRDRAKKIAARKWILPQYRIRRKENYLFLCENFVQLYKHSQEM